MTKDKSDLPVGKINMLAEILKEQGLTEIEVESDGLKIKVRKEPESVAYAAPIHSSAAPTAGSSAPAAKDTGASLYELKSPMVGTFYASSSPDAEPFVKTGDKINKGETVGIVEAMKLMNELPSDVSGEIVEICVQNAEAVSYGQVIMKIRLA